MLTLAPVVVALGSVGSEIGMIFHGVNPQVNDKSQEKVHVWTAQKPDILLSVARSSHILVTERIPKLVARNQSRSFSRKWITISLEYFFACGTLSIQISGLSLALQFVTELLSLSFCLLTFGDGLEMSRRSSWCSSLEKPTMYLHSC
jgi:hypothetical protein